MKPSSEEVKVKLLSQKEVNSLHHRSRVCIRWSGGNGPFQYTVVHRNGRTYTLHELPGSEEYMGSEVEFVGKRHFHTWVWLPSGTTPAGVTGLMVSGDTCRGCEVHCPWDRHHGLGRAKQRGDNTSDKIT